MDELTRLVIESAALAGALTALLTFANLIQGAWRRTVGKRQEIRRILSRLGSTVRFEYIERLLGPSTFRSSISSDLREDLFLTDYVVVQTLSTQDESVIVLAATVTDKRLKPRFWLGLPGSLPSQEVVLGLTRFGDIQLLPDSRHAFLGARRSGYWETFYLGNPGGYQSYLLMHTDAGAGSIGNLDEVLEEEGWDENLSPEIPTPPINKFRAETVINTFAVTAPHLSHEDLMGIQIGADLDVIRLIPSSRWARWRASRQSRRRQKLGI